MSELLEKILEKKNMNEAYKKVCANKGAGGVDGMELEELDGFIRKNWNSIREQIRGRSYKPQPVRRVEIPKPNGSKRKLGIPTVMDRVIQQGIAQIISPMCEPLFSDHSYGFRPNRSCEMAIKDMLMFLNEGYEWIVDIDLEKFFDNVPQDKLMSLVHNIINDGDTESLIRKYLKAGVMVQGRYEKTEQGTPQGGNLSPLLSNIMLNELDKELERRGLGFVRYADDCVIAVRSEASAKRVMYSITDWIERKLGLKVNADKTHITRPMNLKYLGFGFWKDSKTKEWKCRPHKDSVQKFKRTLKKVTERRKSMAFAERVKQLNRVIRGWINYFAIGRMKTAMTDIDAHLRTRLRVIIWKQWKVPKKRQWGLQKLGIGKDLARQTSYMGDHYQWIVTKTCVVRAISKEKLKQAGLVSCYDYYMERHALKLC
ncbi:group II intron reverse transcriptase/maturase [Anaerostipes hominis (ex Lee et al. 2021)]|uniref:group II intron reverse transcriptase/maturase n=1 Tax=Anaerostipes hominis (ex Lee et al. 2021) TaxID=2025494 RepID=UPI0022E89068|nr:group II intron reverse transcriptase/maturase [Anaerostipes hominis (ex Lee et al. 2021)]